MFTDKPVDVPLQVLATDPVVRTLARLLDDCPKRLDRIRVNVTAYVRCRQDDDGREYHRFAMILSTDAMPAEAFLG